MKSKKRNSAIEKGLPVPPKGANKKIYYFEELQVGDSMMLFDKSINQVNAAIYRDKKKNPKKKYTLRTLENGVRVYRLK